MEKREPFYTVSGIANWYSCYRRQYGTGRKTDQWKKIENPEMNPHTYGNLRIYSRAETASSISGVGKTGHICAKE